MNHTKLTVKTKSANLWWGIYGFCDKTGWEDIFVFNDKDEELGRFCLSAKRFFRHGVEGLRNDPTQQEFVQRIDLYLSKNEIDYSYSYCDEDDDDFYEVSFDAPRNSKNIKPGYMEIWHTDEAIDLSTIRSATEHFAQKFLKIAPVEIYIDETEAGFDEMLQSYKEHMTLFGEDGEMPVAFSDELVQQLSEQWKLSEEDTLEKLKRAIQ